MADLTTHPRQSKQYIVPTTFTSEQERHIRLSQPERQKLTIWLHGSPAGNDTWHVMVPKSASQGQIVFVAVPIRSDQAEPQIADKRLAAWGDLRDELAELSQLPRSQLVELARRAQGNWRPSEDPSPSVTIVRQLRSEWD